MLSALKKLVDNKRLLDSFNNYVDYLIANQHKAMEQADTNVLLYRTQGAISVLRKLKYLREEVIGADKQ